MLEDGGLHIDFVQLYMNITYVAFPFCPKIYMATRLFKLITLCTTSQSRRIFFALIITNWSALKTQSSGLYYLQ